MLLKKLRNRQLDGAIKKLICIEKRAFLLSRQGYVFELKLPWRGGSRRPQTDFFVQFGFSAYETYISPFVKCRDIKSFN